ncbi:OmpA family protein [Ancylomarina sp.]|uniref:OmpA family protein n=1 Tax=Ancylomarina sp. TaxID=1970196 RepID=UPI0035668464
MRILIIGIFSFIAWSTLSTFVYVCKIKGLCDEQVTMQNSEVNNDSIVNETIVKPLEQQAIVPKDLTICFEFDNSEFSSNSIAEKYFDESNAYLNQNTQARLEIIGHTDAIGTNTYNNALGYRRAQSMQRYFETKGMIGDKITIISKGESEPADNNDTKDGRANNRRALLTIKQ